MVVRRVTVILALGALLGGCLTSQFNFAVKPTSTETAGRKLNLSAGLELSPEFCTYIHTSAHQGGKNVFRLGPTLCGYAKRIVMDSFATATVADNGVFKNRVDVIVKPKVTNVTVFYRTGVIPAKVESVILLEWDITDRGYDVIFR